MLPQYVEFVHTPHQSEKSIGAGRKKMAFQIERPFKVMFLRCCFSLESLVGVITIQLLGIVACSVIRSFFRVIFACV